MGRIKETEKLKKEGKEKVKRVGIKRIVKLKKERNLKVKKVGMERAVEQEKERKVKVAKIRKIEQGRVKAKAKKRKGIKKERAKKMVGTVLKWLRVYTTSFGVLIFLLSKFLSNVWRTKSKTNFSTIVIGDKICILSTKTI